MLSSVFDQTSLIQFCGIVECNRSVVGIVVVHTTIEVFQSYATNRKQYVNKITHHKSQSIALYSNLLYEIFFNIVFFKSKLKIFEKILRRIKHTNMFSQSYMQTFQKNQLRCHDQTKLIRKSNFLRVTYNIFLLFIENIHKIKIGYRRSLK